MATGEFHSVPEVDLLTATDEVFGSCIADRRSRDKAGWMGKPFVDLAESRPDELPPLFLAVGAEALSPSKGWTTEHGSWVPKDLFAGPRFVPKISGRNTVEAVVRVIWARTMLVFRPKDGSKSDLQMTLYNEIIYQPHEFKLLLEEDMTLCRVSRIPKANRKGIQARPYALSSLDYSNINGVSSAAVVHSKVSPNSFWKSQFGFAADPVNEFSKLDSDLDVADFPHLDMPEFHYFEDAQDNSVGGWDLPSIDSSGGPKKRPRPKPGGVSEVWQNFTKIYTRDREVVYAACNHCGRMFKLKGGSTSSLLKHSKTCQCKPDNSVDTLH